MAIVIKGSLTAQSFLPTLLGLRPSNGRSSLQSTDLNGGKKAMPETLEAENRQEAVRGMSDSARKAKPIVPPRPLESEAAEPAIVRAAGEVMTISARQSEAIMRSWEETVRLGLDGFVAWTNARDIWAEGCQELLQSTFNATQQATKMMAQTSAQLFSMGTTLVARAAEPMGRFGEAR
jgi:hypothetical protein